MTTRLFVALAFVSVVGCFDSGPEAIEDDFCHGLRDGVECDDGNPCTSGDRCGAGVCLGRLVADQTVCDDDNLCTEASVCLAGQCMGEVKDCSTLTDQCNSGTCDLETGACVADPVEDGRICEDANNCTLQDACAAGVCVGEAKVCPGEQTQCSAPTCDAGSGECYDAPKADGLQCNDGDKCTLSDACSAGECLGEPKFCGDGDPSCQETVCESNSGDCIAVDRPDGTVCDDGNSCTDGEICSEGLCGGGVEVTNGALCDDGDPCSVLDQCDGGVCGGKPMDCSDLNVGQCVVGVCDAGACAEQEIESEECFCHDQEDGVACDDADPCTLNDVCTGGECRGDSKDCSELDGMCVAGGCDPTVGECVTVPLPDGPACDDDSPCTNQDACFSGTCVGKPVDCSALDGMCGLGQCEAETGACVVAPVPDQTPCDDGDACTGQDECTEGLCTGLITLCVCAGKEPGEACDDGNPCTSDEVCEQGADSLVCLGATKDCSDLDGACLLGICDETSGECGTVPRPDGLVCDDADSCTEDDACLAGTCEGPGIEMCGGSAAMCEDFAAADETALAVEISAAPTTVFGRIEQASETDYFEVELLEGQLLDVETRQHCASGLDTQILVYAPGGTTLVTSDDDGGEDKWSKVSQLEITATGTWVIGVTAYTTSGTGGYFLDVAADFPPPCETDADCDCDQLTCVLEGQSAGQCVPKMPAESEPNDAPAESTPTAVGEAIRGELTPGDVDWYTLELEAGIPVTLTTQSWCGAAVDPELLLEQVGDAETPATAVAYDADSAGDGQASIAEYVATTTGTYRVKVTDQAATGGEYVLTIEDARCTQNEDCGCSDEICQGDAEAPGLCIPALDAPEEAPTTVLIPAQRVHAKLDAAYDQDSFAIDLTPGQWTFTTEPFCGSDTDTELTLYAPDGAPYATDSDSGTNFFATLTAVTIETEGQWTLEVSGYGASTGSYIVTVTPTE